MTAEDSIPACPCCGSEAVVVLGGLGRIVYARCQQCGADFRADPAPVLDPRD